MGKLNSLIKFLVININGFLALGGLGIIVVASIVLSSDFVQLNEVLPSLGVLLTPPHGHIYWDCEVMMLHVD